MTNLKCQTIEFRFKRDSKSKSEDCASAEVGLALRSIGD